MAARKPKKPEEAKKPDKSPIIRVKHDELPVELITDVVGHMTSFSFDPYVPDKSAPVEVLEVQRLRDGVSYFIAKELDKAGKARAKTKLSETALTMHGFVMVSRERVNVFHKRFLEMTGRQPSFRQIVKAVANSIVTMTGIKFDTDEFKPMFMYSWRKCLTWEEVSIDTTLFENQFKEGVWNTERRIRHMLNGVDDLHAGVVRSPPCRLCVCHAALNEALNHRMPDCAKCPESRSKTILP